ncbi:hypothetical protein, conserved [Eimeria acervulina]|uniref:tRNA(Ile)-lysidine synthetase n=1 Tax=Eimeria acervulina TaxID=5801 RepID=U6GD17_EIMAC|nr:hypothetical protein, conserved [Eimeria acervulina]CDI78010.1 hypothetical protein, conserved [Eimeria acervulina]
MYMFGLRVCFNCKTAGSRPPRQQDPCVLLLLLQQLLLLQLLLLHLQHAAAGTPLVPPCGFLCLQRGSAPLSAHAATAATAAGNPAAAAARTGGAAVGNPATATALAGTAAATSGRHIYCQGSIANNNSTGHRLYNPRLAAAARGAAATTALAAAPPISPADAPVDNSNAAVETVDAAAASFLLRVLQQQHSDGCVESAWTTAAAATQATAAAAKTRQQQQLPVLLLSCSGGSDSTALLHAVARGLGLSAATPRAVAAAAAACSFEQAVQQKEQHKQRQQRQDRYGLDSIAEGTGVSNHAPSSSINNSSSNTTTSGNRSSSTGMAACMQVNGMGAMVAAVYFDHRLRPREARKEQQQIAAACRAYGIPLHCRQLPDSLLSACKKQQQQQANSKRSSKGSPQQLMRNWRRVEAAALLTKIIHQQQQQQQQQQQHRGYLLTGHHADDQLETIFLKLLRGVNVLNLHGMEPLSALTADDAFHHVACQQELAGLQQLASQNQLAIGRPFLDLPKETLRSYLKALGSVWSEDSSNGSPKYLRNAFRSAVLPALVSFTQQQQRDQQQEQQEEKQSEGPAAVAADLVEAPNAATGLLPTPLGAAADAAAAESAAASTPSSSTKRGTPTAATPAAAAEVAGAHVAALRRRLQLLHSQVLLLKRHINQEASAWERAHLGCTAAPAAAAATAAAAPASAASSETSESGHQGAPTAATDGASAATGKAEVPHSKRTAMQPQQQQQQQQPKQQHQQQQEELPLTVWAEVKSEFIQLHLLHRWLQRGMGGGELQHKTIQLLSGRLAAAAALKNSSSRSSSSSRRSSSSNNSWHVDVGGGFAVAVDGHNAFLIRRPNRQRQQQQQVR